MDPEMSREAKTLLERYRSAESLGSDARARMLSGLRAKIAVGGPGVGVPKASLRPLVSKLAAAGKAKIVLGVLAVALPAAWTIHHSHRSVDYTLRTATPAVPAAPEVPAQPAAAPANGANGVAASASGGPAAAPIPFSDLPAVETAPEARAPAKHVAPSSRVATAASNGDVASSPSNDTEAPRPSAIEANPAELPSAAPASTLDQEVALLKRAHLAEKAGQPSEALAILAEHAKAFPNGKLAESRDAARVIALCEAGQREASRAAAERFLAARPNSPFANRVRSVCTSGDGRP